MVVLRASTKFTRQLFDLIDYILSRTLSTLGWVTLIYLTVRELLSLMRG